MGLTPTGFGVAADPPPAPSGAQTAGASATHAGDHQPAVSAENPETRDTSATDTSPTRSAGWWDGTTCPLPSNEPGRSKCASITCGSTTMERTAGSMGNGSYTWRWTSTPSIR